MKCGQPISRLTALRELCRNDAGLVQLPLGGERGVDDAVGDALAYHIGYRLRIDRVCSATPSKRELSEKA